MSGKYNPDDGAEPVGLWETVFLSNRDLSAQIPVNFVTHPGVYLTSACFSNGTYTASVTEKCVSNLLATQFRRLILDLYWDETHGQFAFCPVTIPSSLGNGDESISLTASAISSASLNGSGTRLVARQATQTATPTGSDAAASNSPSSGSTQRSGTLSTIPSSTSTTSLPPIATLPSINGETLYELGPYACSPTLDLSFFISVMSDYLSQTSDTIHAKLVYLEFNLHAAASRADATGAAPEPKAFPGPEMLVGAQFFSLNNSPLYQPSDLETERNNLNDTWFKNPESRWPIAAYFNTEEISGGDIASPDGWPDENYIQITMAKRVFLTWGAIDPQMTSYNFSGDSSTVFANDQLSTPQPIEAKSNGELSSGCYYNTSVPLSGVSSDNSSWALTTYDNDSFRSTSLVNNITSCGISPILNHSLIQSGAGTDLEPYTSFARSAIWNWAEGEPRNTSAPGVDLDAPESQYRCAYFDASTSTGRWYVQDCLHNYQVACRINNAPYGWTLSDDSVPFSSAPAVCTGNTSFSVPRTGLENTYLYNHVLSVRRTTDSDDPKGLWINFNSLDLEGCWVNTGPNGTCPYYEDPNATQSRQVLVPTIGAIIVFILTALTLFVKCNVNRRNSKNRRRGEGGWDYEGVPS